MPKPRTKIGVRRRLRPRLRAGLKSATESLLSFTIRWLGHTNLCDRRAVPCGGPSTGRAAALDRGTGLCIVAMKSRNPPEPSTFMNKLLPHRLGRPLGIGVVGRRFRRRRRRLGRIARYGSAGRRRHPAAFGQHRTAAGRRTTSPTRTRSGAGRAATPGATRRQSSMPSRKPALSRPSPDREPPEAGRQPALSAADAAVAEKLRDLIENKLRQHVSREQDRAGVEHSTATATSRRSGSATMRHCRAPGTRSTFLHGVAADGLDPADYPTPNFADIGPDALAADELKLTNSVLHLRAPRQHRTRRLFARERRRSIST